MSAVRGDSSRASTVPLRISNSGAFFWDIERLRGKMGSF
jgi:hypothetical protein